MGRNARGHVAALGRVVAQAEHGEHVAQAGEADTDAPLGDGLVALLWQRPIGQIEHVVECAHLRRHDFVEGLEVERGRAVEAERMAHEAGQDDRAEVAAAIGGQRLFAAVVHHESVRVEGVNIQHGDVEYVLDAVIGQRVHRGREAFAIHFALVAGQRRIQPRGLVGVAKADALGIDAQVVAADDQFMVGARGVVPLAATPVRHGAQLGRATVGVDGRGDAQAQQHALHGRQQVLVALRQAHADAFVLCALNRAIGVEQATQQPLGKCRG